MSVRPLLLVGLATLAAGSLAAQQQPRANWALAEKFNTDAVTRVSGSTSITPRWIGQSDSMWYNWRDASGYRTMLVVPRTRTRQPLFDHKKLAAALSAETRKPVEYNAVQITALVFAKDRRSFNFTTQGDTSCYTWTLASQTVGRAARAACTDSTQQGGRAGGGGGGGGGGQGRAGGTPPDFRNFSPDSARFVFARDHNLFVVNVATKDTVQVTRDGEKDYTFGFRDTVTVNTQQQQQQEQQQEQVEETTRQGGAASRDPRVRPNITWSPDSRAFFIQRSDNRKVKELYLVNSLSSNRPTLMSYRYAMPGETDVAQQELHTWRVGDAGLTKLKIEKWRDQRLFQPHFTTGSDRLRLIRRDRLQRNMELIEVTLATNTVTTLITESLKDANLEMQPMRYVTQNTGPKGTKEGDILWWSERTGWGHYYLYDHNGRFKNAITDGTWRAVQVVSLDSARRVAYIAGVGREDGENPYYRHLYRVNLDGSGFSLLDAGDATHASTLSPSRRFIVDNYSRVDLVPKSVIRDETGKVMMDLETADLTKLREMGWRAPERFVVKAADGVTDIYGNIFRPFDFDSTKKYPIIASVYPGPQTEQVTYTFTANSTQQRLAQLGFVVIQIGNRGGSPDRSNAYQSYSYYNLRDYGLADKKAGIEQLAARHRWIDLDKVGIYGHSGGGFMTGAALMLPPYNDFFKVGVSSAGNHDNNIYNQNWSEQYHGLREVIVRPPVVAAGTGVAQQGRANGAANGAGRAGGAGAAASNGTRIVPVDDSVRYEIRVPTNTELANNLKGKLLLVHGDMDNNVHPGGTIRLVDALIRANKRFDMMIMPGQAHGFGPMQTYFNRMMFEYFAEHLLGDYYRGGADIRD